MRFRCVMLMVVAAGVRPAASQDTVIKTETREVLVDAVVTDKKDSYVRDLTAKDFHVFEDGKEQTVTSFSFTADPKNPSDSQKHYLVLFFDNSTMDYGDQARARQAAAKFIDSNAGPNRFMAIANFGGSLAIAQNFTSDTEKLKKAASGVGFSPVSPNAPTEVASLGSPRLAGSESQFGVRSVMLALISMAKSLSTVPGRKILVLFTDGFPLSAEFMSELTDTISACNRANVAIYPIDVRGLVTGVTAAPGGATLRFPEGSDTVPVAPVSFSFGNSFLPQHGGGGGGTGGGTGGGGGHGGGGTGGGGSHGGGGTGGGGRGGNGGTGAGRSGSSNPLTQNPYNQSRNIIPPFPPSAQKNQEMMYALANGTGGFVIINTNDLLGGLEKIAREQDQFYLLGYTPPESAEGSCHTLKVKVDRSGTSVRARSGYCVVKPVDLLAGDPVEKSLESRLNGGAPATAGAGASMEAPFFYTSPNVARVNVALEIPAGAVKFEKVKGKFHAAVNILGIAYRPDGGVAARFSDTVKLEAQDKKEMQAFSEQPLHYEDQFDIASGKYTLKVAFTSSGQDFGKVETPLAIDPYDGKHFGLSAVALSKQLHKVADLGTSLDALLLKGDTPLISQGMQVTPSGANRFKKTDPTAVYVEIYEPLLTEKDPPVVGIQLRVLDRKTNEAKQDSGMMGVTSMGQTGNPVVPVALKLPIADLVPGSYRAEVKATDSVGNESAVRTADFEVE